MGKNTIILAAGLAGVGKRTHFKKLAEMSSGSMSFWSCNVDVLPANAQAPTNN